MNDLPNNTREVAPGMYLTLEYGPEVSPEELQRRREAWQQKCAERFERCIKGFEPLRCDNCAKEIGFITEGFDMEGCHFWCEDCVKNARMGGAK